MRRVFVLLAAVLTAADLSAATKRTALLRTLSGSGGGGGGDPAATDTFTEAANADLGAHTADTGQTWTDRDSTSNADINATTDRLFPSAQGGGGGWAYTVNVTPTDADYCASLDIWVVTSAKASIGPAVRVAAGASGDYITARYDGGNLIKVYERTGGSTSGLGAGWSVTAPTVTAQTLKLCSNGSNVDVYFNGSLLGSQAVTTSATGKPGIAGFFPDTTEANTYVDNYRVDNALP